MSKSTYLRGFYSFEERIFYVLLLLGGAVTLLGLGAAYYMEEHGHIVTGMNNQVVWGLPHVFAIFMIVAASGALNVASIGSVFGRKLYKPRAPLSGLLSVAMAGGRVDGVDARSCWRADRVLVAADELQLHSLCLPGTSFSIPAWSPSSDFICGQCLKRRMNQYSKAVGIRPRWSGGRARRSATGTGSTLRLSGCARQAYQSALLAPVVHRVVVWVGLGSLSGCPRQRCTPGTGRNSPMPFRGAWPACWVSSWLGRSIWWRSTTAPISTLRARVRLSPSFS